MPRAVRVGLSVGLRVVLVALLLYGATHQSVPRYHGKAFPARLVAYSLLTSIVPAIWLIRGRRETYPFAIDQLVIVPFLFDAIGNTLNLYDRIWWWDKLEHGVNWAVLVGAVSLALAHTTLGRIERAALAIGFGAVAGIVWELAEYVTFIRGNPSALAGAYTDTLGDLLCDLTGATVAAAAFVLLSRRASPARAR